MSSIKGNRWVTLGIICIGFLMILIDITIVNVSIPTIIKDLHATLPDMEWVISGYALMFAAFLITFGRLGDMYGRKNFFLLGLLVFVIASAFSGEAHSPATLIIARLAQGLGGAMIAPATLSLISSNFRGRDRAIAFGVWGAIAGFAVAVGPILGGYITTYHDWRWIFRINIPVGIIGMLAAWFFVLESKETIKHKLDISGMVTSALGFFFLVFALIEGQSYGWINPKKDFSALGFTWGNTQLSIIPITIWLALVFLTAFLWIEHSKTEKHKDPAIDLEFFKLKTFRYGLIAIAVIALGEFSSLFTLPIYWQSIKGYTPLRSGLSLLPMALATFIAAPLSARLVNAIGTKWVISTGIFLEFAGIFWLSFTTIDTSYNSLIAPLIVMGAGIGLAIAQNTQVILSEIPVEHSGSASGILNTIRQVGTALGIAIVGAVLATQITTHLRTEISSVNLPVQIKQGIVDKAGEASVQAEGVDYKFTAEVPDAIKNNPFALAAFEQQQADTKKQVKRAIDVSLTKSITEGMRVGALFMLIGTFLSLFIPNVKHKPEITAEVPTIN